MSDNIKVVVKVRPFIKREIEENLTLQWNVRDNSLLQIDQNGKDTTCKFYFDRVYDQDTETSNLYDEIAKPIVEAAIAGINGTIFAYGQTSSGKTYTMMGDENSLGIIPLSVYNIFEKIQSIPDRDFLVRVSYIEIYNEKIRDLLCYSKKDIKIHENVQGNIKVDATEEVTSSAEHVLELMKQGEGNREIGSTNMNEQSSRSHTIFQIIIESRMHTESGEEGDGYVNVSMLNLVDLAGSERSGQTGATGQRFKEGTHINKSLSSLGLVIKQLSEDQNKFINYRDSKLTRILQNSLGGNAKTSIICAVTPAVLEETISTLQFASRAKAIKNKPEVNAVVTNATMLQALTKKLASLQYELESKRHLEHDNQMLSQKIEELQHKILNGIVSRPDRQAVVSNRRQTWCAPRAANTHHAPSKLPAFVTPSLDRFKSDPAANNKVTMRSSGAGGGGGSFSERDEDSFVRERQCSPDMDVDRHVDFVTPRRNNVRFNEDEVIQLDDSVDEQQSSSRPCSPYHLCYDTSQTPPCVLRQNSKQAEKKLNDLLEHTEMEKMYGPKEIELIKKLDYKSKQVQNLEEKADQSMSKCKDYEAVILDKEAKSASLESALQHKEKECEELKEKLEKEVASMKEIVSLTQKERDTVLKENAKEIESLQCKLTDLEFSFETLKQKSKQRESELLSLLQNSSTRWADVSGDGGMAREGAEPKQRSFHFLDMSKDISLIGGENDVSLIKNDPPKFSDQSNTEKLIKEKNECITDLQRKLTAREMELEAVQQKHVFSINKLQKEMATLQEDLENSKKDVESYCNLIQDIKKPNVDRSRQETNTVTASSDELFHIEEGVTANNKVLSATIEKFKKKVESKNKEILELKALKAMRDVDCQTDGSLTLDNEENERIAFLENELAECKYEITDREKMLTELQKNFESKDSTSTKKGQGDMTVEADHECCKQDVIIQDHTQNILAKQNKMKELSTQEVEGCQKCQLSLQQISTLNQTLAAQNSENDHLRTEIHCMRKTLENVKDIEEDVNLKQLKILNLTEQCSEKHKTIVSLEKKILELHENNSSLKIPYEESCKKLELAIDKSNTLEEELQSERRKLEESALHIVKLESKVQQFTSTSEEPDSLVCDTIFAEKETHINNLIAENTELNLKLSEYLNELTKLKVQLEVQSQLQETVSACEIKIADMLQQLKLRDEKLEQLIQENKYLDNKVIDQCNQISELNGEIQQTSDKLEEIQQLAAAYKIQLCKNSEEFGIITQTSREATCKVQSLNENCEILRVQLAEKQNTVQELEIQLQMIRKDNLKSTSGPHLQLQEHECSNPDIDSNFEILSAKIEAQDNGHKNCQTVAGDSENKLKESINEQNRLRALVDFYQKELKVEQEVQSELRGKLCSCEEQITEILKQKDQQLEQLMTEKQDSRNTIIEHCNQISKLNVEIEETSDELKKIKQLLSSYEIRLSEKSREVDTITQSFSDANYTIQRLTEHSEVLKAQVTEKHDITLDLQVQLETIQTANLKLSSDLNQTCEKYECLCAELRTNLEELTAAKDVLDREHKKCQTTILDYESKLQENIHEQNRLHALITFYEKEISDAKQDKAYFEEGMLPEQLVGKNSNRPDNLREQIHAVNNDHFKLTNDLNIQLEKYKGLCIEKDADLQKITRANEVLTVDLIQCQNKIRDFENQMHENIQEKCRLQSLITASQKELLDAKQELQNVPALEDELLRQPLSKKDISTNDSPQNTVTSYETPKNEDLCNLSGKVQVLNEDTDSSNRELTFLEEELELSHTKCEEIASVQYFIPSPSQEKDNSRKANGNVVNHLLKQREVLRNDNCALRDTIKKLNEKFASMCRLHEHVEGLKSHNTKLQEHLLALHGTEVNPSQYVQTSKPMDVFTEEDALNDNEKKLIIELEIDKTKCDILENVKDIELLQGQLNSLKSKCVSSTEHSECRIDSSHFGSYTQYLFPNKTQTALQADNSQLESEIFPTAEKDCTLTKHREISTNEAALQRMVDSCSSKMDLLKSENVELKEDVRKLIESNVQLLKEKEDIGALSKETEELHRRIAWHRSNLCTLTATTYAENKLLKSKLCTLQHKHTRLHIVCERSKNEFKVLLHKLYQLLQSDPKFEFTNRSYLSSRPLNHNYANSTLATCSSQTTIHDNSDCQTDLSLDVNNVSAIECPRLFTSTLEEMSFTDDTIISKHETVDKDETLLLTAELNNFKSTFTQTDDAEANREHRDILHKYQTTRQELEDLNKKYDKLSKLKDELQVENDSLSNDIMDRLLEFDNLKSEIEVYKNKYCSDNEFTLKLNPLRSNDRESQTRGSQPGVTVEQNIVSNVCGECLARNEKPKHQSQLNNSTLNDSDKENDICNKFELTTTAFEEMKKKYDSLKRQIRQTAADCNSFIQAHLDDRTEWLQVDDCPLNMIKRFHEIEKNNNNQKYVLLVEKNQLIEKELHDTNYKLTTLEMNMDEKEQQLQMLKGECDSLKHTAEEMKHEFMDYVLVSIGNADFVDSSERNSSYLHIMKKVLEFTASQHQIELEALNTKIQILDEEKLGLELKLQETCKKGSDIEEKLISLQTENDYKINELNMQLNKINSEKCDLLQQTHLFDDKCKSLDRTCHELRNKLFETEEQMSTLHLAKIALDTQITEFQSRLSNEETLRQDHTSIVDRVKGLELEGEKLRGINKVLSDKHEMSVKQVTAYELLITQSKAQLAVLERKISQMEVECVEKKCILQTKFVELSTEKTEKEELNARIQAMQREHAQSQQEMNKAKHELSQATRELSQEKLELGQAKHELGQAKLELGQAKLELSLTQQQLIQVKEELSQVQQGYQLRCKEYRTLEAKSAAYEVTISRLQTENEKINLKLIENNARQMDGEDKLRELMKRCESFEKQCEECAAKLKKAEDKADNYHTVNEILEVRVSELQSEVDDFQRSSVTPTPGHTHTPGHTPSHTPTYTHTHSPTPARRKRQSLHDAVRQQQENYSEKDLTRSGEHHENGNWKVVSGIEQMRSEAQDIQKLGAAIADYEKQCADLKYENVKLLQINKTLTTLLKDKASKLEQLNTEKEALENKLIGLGRGAAKDNNKDGPAPALHEEVGTNADGASRFGSELLSAQARAVVDRMTHDLAMDRNKELAQHNQELLQQLQLHNQQSSELRVVKKELAASKVAYAELQEKYREVDEECEICAKYLRDKEAAYERLFAAKEALEAKVSDLLGQLDGEQKHSLSLMSARKKRQSLYDQRRTCATEVCDVATNTHKEELPGYNNLVDKMTYEAEKEHCRKLKKKVDDMKLRISELTQELRRLQRHQAAADDNTASVLQESKEAEQHELVVQRRNPVVEQQTPSCEAAPQPMQRVRYAELEQRLQQAHLRNVELEQQLLRASAASPATAPTLLLAPGSAIVQSQQLSDYVEENHRLKKMNTKLIKLVKGRQAKGHPARADAGE